MVVGLLKCYCNFESCPNSTCETDGYCYAATSLDRGLAKHTYHCIELKSLIPIEHPFSCSSTKTRNESVAIQCCKSHDMCNQDLRLEIRTKPQGNRRPLPYVRSRAALPASHSLPRTAACLCRGFHSQAPLPRRIRVKPPPITTIFS
ncbi:jg6059 [Pararge aegeria aegeria]|uniref:Jg6059 protein n=1 Tax=Pararge aegeria aegeria TaxID=348720 RepID=A0A8S4R8G7_9NEOP|nr:jg6059 [Pararge aegeria aegeria]